MMVPPCFQRAAKLPLDGQTKANFLQIRYPTDRWHHSAAAMGCGVFLG
jgi:hypothetical protein